MRSPYEVVRREQSGPLWGEMFREPSHASHSFDSHNGYFICFLFPFAGGLSANRSAPKRQKDAEPPRGPPQLRLPQRVLYLLFIPVRRRSLGQPIGAEAPEGGVAPEALLKESRVLPVGAGQVDGELKRHRARGARVDPLPDRPPCRRRVDLQKAVQSEQGLLREEVDVLQEANEDLVLPVEGAPDLERAQVVRHPAPPPVLDLPAD